MTNQEFSKMIEPILDPEDGDLLQVIYLRLADGTLLPFLGPVIAREEFEGIDGLGLGDLVEVRHGEGHESRTTVQSSYYQ